jgi:hypothetical protein
LNVHREEVRDIVIILDIFIFGQSSLAWLSHAVIMSLPIGRSQTLKTVIGMYSASSLAYDETLVYDYGESTVHMAGPIPQIIRKSEQVAVQTE